jgi:hypothetical protein
MRRIACLLAGVLATSTAAAQPADVPALVKLVETQPADMDKSTWKEKRRDAARRLGQSKDKRAVPALIKLAETETFDIVGEIAIEGLGNLNDQSAVPVLQRIANDPSREKPQRDLARKALGKLGASADVKPGGTTTTPPGGTTGGTTTTTGGTTGTTGDVTTGGPDPTAGLGTVAPGSELLGGGKTAADLPELPDLPDDTLGAFERVTFALGTAQLQYDTVRERSSFDFDVAGFYAKRVERESMAWGWDAGAHVVAGFINPTGREQVRGAQINLTANGEARFYKGNVYGLGKAAAGVQVSYFAFKDVDPNNDEKDARTTMDLQIALGGGYGRVLDVGGAIRVRRLSRTLDAARALGKPIDSATARQLELTWWALRSERSSYRALVATVAILRQAGILLVEPDAGLTYEILSVLHDPQLFLRPSGFDIQIAFSEGYLIRPEEEGVVAPSGEEDRVEQALFLAGYGKQLAEDKLEVSGAAYGRLRLFAPEEQPEPWAVGASARMRRFTYGEHGEPFGAFDLAGDVRLSDADNLADDDDDIGLRVSGQLGFTWWINQASGFRLAANVAVDGGELFVGAQLAATYGFLDATFAGL